jgi:hypothetical protein
MSRGLYDDDDNNTGDGEVIEKLTADQIRARIDELERMYTDRRPGSIAATEIESLKDLLKASQRLECGYHDDAGDPDHQCCYPDAPYRKVTEVTGWYCCGDGYDILGRMAPREARDLRGRWRITVEFWPEEPGEAVK